MVTKRDSRVGAREINYEFGINKHTLLYINQIKTRTYCIAWGNYSQYLVIIYNGKESENIYMCIYIYAHQFSSVQSLSHVRLFVTPWTAACQASLSITNSRSSLRLTSIESVMPFSHLILCRPLFLLPPIPPSIRVFSNESTLRMR